MLARLSPATQFADLFVECTTKPSLQPTYMHHSGRLVFAQFQSICDRSFFSSLAPNEPVTAKEMEVAAPPPHSVQEVAQSTTAVSDVAQSTTAVADVALFLQSKVPEVIEKTSNRKRPPTLHGEITSEENTHKIKETTKQPKITNAKPKKTNAKPTKSHLPVHAVGLQESQVSCPSNVQPQHRPAHESSESIYTFISRVTIYI